MGREGWWGRGLSGRMIVSGPAWEEWPRWEKFRSWRNEGQGGVFVADAAKIVAVEKFFVAESGRIGRMVVSETATKVWPHSGRSCIWGASKYGA